MHTRSADAADAAGTRFGLLVTPHLDRLLAFACRHSPTKQDAEDAVQEACTRAWLAFDELRDEEKARPWLYRILRAVLSDVRSREGRRQRLVPITRYDEAAESMLAAADDGVFAEVEARITHAVVRAALDDIPEDFATAVELHDLDGLKYQEIADVVGIPIGTVMSRISRGRRLLAGAVIANQRVWIERSHGAAKAAGATHRPGEPR